MSYAMAPTFEGNRIGVRRVYQLAGMGSAVDPDTISTLVSYGFDPSLLNTAVAMGVSDEQLQALPFPDDPSTENAALMNLINQLGGAQAATGAPASSAGSFPQAAIPSTISTAFGVYDLSQEAAWAQISGLFTSTQTQLNQLASLAPNDADVAAMVQQFNGYVVQWAGYYQQAFGSAPSPLPLASQATLSGLGVVPLVVLGVAGIAAVALLLGGLYAIKQNAAVKLAQIQANVQVAQNSTTALMNQINTLNSQAAAISTSNPTQAAALRAQAASLTAQAGIASTSAITTSSTSQLSSWFTQNWIGVAAVVLGIAVLPPLVKKL